MAKKSDMEKYLDTLVSLAVTRIEEYAGTKKKDHKYIKNVITEAVYAAASTSADYFGGK